MIAVFTGNGKGKTTSALGAALRAVGRGQRVLMVQFIKGPWKSGEDTSTSFLSDEIVQKKLGTGGLTFKKMGLGFVGILGDSLPFTEHEQAAQKALAYIDEHMSQYDMVIMDEVNVATSLKLVSPGEVLAVVRKMPEEKLIVLTGRGAPQEFIDVADLATEMKELKHPYNNGKLGKINVEF